MTDWLELRVPPLALTVALLLVLAVADRLVPALSIASGTAIWPGALVALAGVAACLSGVHAFLRAGTTVNPTRPHTAGQIVQSGIYGWTRNPMYLGFTLVLVGLSIALLNWLGLVLAAAFTIYIDRMQIRPEEKALRERFGAEFSAYERRVRRWI